MIPEDFTLSTTTVKMPTRTYKIDWESGHIGGFIDGKEAIGQAVELAVSTERYMWDIYSYNYGSEIHTLIGKSDEYALSEMKRMITDALLPDRRVKETSDFAFERTRDGVKCSFKVNTTAGDIDANV